MAEASTVNQAYCVKCKTKRDITESQNVTMKNGKSAITGKCGTCGTKMFRITGK